jgi:uncharacterized Fe-S cluster-containing radical SAM superfamily protein
LAYEPVERHRKIENLVVQSKVGGDLKKYYRFRHDRWYGGIITADCAGCGLTCKFCWVRKESILEGREPGEFLKPEAVAERFFKLMKENRIHQGRISGGEPTIGRSHLFQILNVFQHKRVRFILETNGILIGEDESYAQELALYPFVHVRVSFKGCNEEEFTRLTGADPRGFHLQLNALRYLKRAGVSAHPAVMLSFSEREAVDQLYSAIWKIDPILHSEIEEEKVILYPHVQEKLKRAGLKAPPGQVQERRGRGQKEGHEGQGARYGEKEGERRNGERAKIERPRIVERGEGDRGRVARGEEKENDQREPIKGRRIKVIPKR